jgi:hypothetical protein
MTITRARFEQDFNSRTLAYLPGLRADTRPVVVMVPASAHTPAGHVLLVSLANQLARAHRSLIFVGNLDQPLLCPDLFGAGTLIRATAGLAQTINPFVDVDVVSTSPIGDRLVTIAIGSGMPADLVVGCDGWLAVFGPGAALGETAASFWGALLAASLTANVAFQRMRGVAGSIDGPYSLWDYIRPGKIQGPLDPSRIDLGRVLQVGAGAVGSALDFFLFLIGLGGNWVIVDGDVVDVSNLNRQLLFVARDAGFPEGEPANKARRASELLGSATRSSPEWFGVDQAVVNASYDVVLALANGGGVRSALQGRQPTVLMHATTSPNWQAQLHRHVAGHDDCIDCRLPPETPSFSCATEPIPLRAGKRFDAALPPLSALAGLLLAVEMVRLQDGQLLNEPENYTAVEISSATPVTRRYLRRCRAHCTSRWAFEERSAINRGTRYQQLDGGLLDSAEAVGNPAKGR